MAIVLRGSQFQGQDPARSAQCWGQNGIHYHQFLQAGENTLNIRICHLLIETICQNNGYDSDDFLKRYIEFMTRPGHHRGPYIEECHRNFSANYARGLPPDQCGVTDVSFSPHFDSSMQIIVKNSCHLSVRCTIKKRGGGVGRRPTPLCDDGRLPAHQSRIRFVRVSGHRHRLRQAPSST